MRRVLSILLGLLLPSFAWVAVLYGVDIRFEPISPKHLPSNYVKSLFQDSEGFIWLATNSGLFRYDGKDVVSYDECLGEYSFIREVIEDGESKLILAIDEGLLSMDKSTGVTAKLITGGPVSSVVLDKDGNIWAGGEDGLFCRSEGVKDFSQAEIKVQGQDVKGIIDILSDRDGNIWLTTWQKGLYVYTPSTGQTRVFKNGLLAYSYIVYQDSCDNIWVGTWGHGILRLDADFMNTSSYVSYPTVSQQGDILYDEVIYAINDIDGNIMIGGQKGFSVMNPDTGECIFYSHGPERGALPYNQVNAILVSRNRNIYLGLYGGGMCRIDYQERPYTVDRLGMMRRKLGTSTINSICDAGDGTYWMGVADNAFVLYDPTDGTIIRYDEIAGLEDLESISTSFAIKKRSVSGEICCGTYSEGLWIYDREKAKVKVLSTQTHPDMLNNSIRSLTNDIYGNLWIGTNMGAYVLTPEDELFSLSEFAPCKETKDFADQVHGLAASDDGKVFLATVQSGIIEVDVAQKVARAHMTSGKQVPFANILVDQDGHVWAGTLNDGLYVLDVSSGILHKAELIKGLDSQCITNLMQSSDGEIWVATANEIITFRCLGEGRIYVLKYISDLAVHFSSSTGLLTDKMLMLGTTDGIFKFDFADLVQAQTNSSTLVITDFIINGVSYREKGLIGKDINRVDRISVQKGDNIEIRYTLLDYNSQMSPVYKCAYNGNAFETAEESIIFSANQDRTVVEISHELSDQVKLLEINVQEEGRPWLIVIIVCLSVCLAGTGLWLIRRSRIRKDSDKDVISFEINSIKFESADQQLLSQAMDVIHRNLSNSDFKQEDFIKEMGISRTQLTDKLKELTGFTPISLIMEVRLKTAYNTIMEAEEKLRVSDVAYSVGFNDAKYFSTCFRKRYGMTPKELLAQRIEKLSEEKEK